MKITVTHDDGSTADITEGVQIAYDIAYGSMDWGSGFLDLEEMEAVARLAEACHFPSFSDALESVQSARSEQERIQGLRDQEARKRAEADKVAEDNQVAIVQRMRAVFPAAASYDHPTLWGLYRSLPPSQREMVRDSSV